MNQEETQTIVLEYDLPHPPAKVWRALTEPELLAKWIMANDMKPAVGEHFTFRMDPTPWWDGIVNCEVLKVEPLQLISYTWGGGPANMEINTVVTFTLKPTAAGGTLLSFEHSGFVPSNKFAYQGARQGWSQNLGEKLPEVLAQL